MFYQEHLLANLLLLFKMNVFLQELNHLPVGISVYGMFLLTKESALTVSKIINCFTWFVCYFVDVDYFSS